MLPVAALICTAAGCGAGHQGFTEVSPRLGMNSVHCASPSHLLGCNLSISQAAPAAWPPSGFQEAGRLCSSTERNPS